MRHGERREQAAGNQHRCANHDPPQAEAVHESGSERTKQSEQQKPQRKRRRDLRIVPAKLALERNDQHAGRAHGAGCHQHGQEGDADHDPAVMDLAAVENGGEPG
jgi:hypothetical protein